MAIATEELKERIEQTRREGEMVKTLSIHHVQPWKDQPRIFFDKKSLDDLARSIKQVGQKKPIDVVVDTEHPGHYIIVDGERRWRACRLINRDTIRAIIVPQESLDDRLVRSVVGNFGGKGHTPYEIAKVLMRIYTTKKHTVPEIAAMFAKSDCWVYQHLSLTKLDQRVVDMMDCSVPFESRLKFAIAILLTKLPMGLQFEIAKHIVDEKIRLKAARHYVEITATEKGHKVGGIASRPERRRGSLMSLLTLLSESLPTFLETPDISLEKFLSNFSDSDLSKLNQLAEQCDKGVKTLCDKIKLALSKVKNK
jgi:ParB family chromosome partitioning protein